MASSFVRRATGTEASEQSGPDWQEVSRAAGLFFDPTATVQIQALPSGQWLHCPGGDLDAIRRAVDALATSAAGVYWSLNPFVPGRYPAGHEKAGQLHAVLVPDVTRRRWLLIDVDSKKPEDDEKINATQQERYAAGAVATAIWRYLAAVGWPEPILVDSGNGWHLYYRLDLPSDADSRTLLRDFLQALAARFNTATADVDASVYNANRIAKLPGTWARRGTHSDERPHRLCRIVSVPEVEGEVVEADRIRQTLASLAEEQPTAAPEPEPRNGHNSFRLRVPSEQQHIVRRAIAYLAKMDPGVQGEYGSNPTFSAARAMVYGFDLGPETGLQILLEHYNPRCTPPWNAKELLHKVEDADTAPFGKARGWLRDAEPPNANGHAFGNGMPGNSPGVAVDAEGCTGAQIILAYFRERYHPVFHAGNAIHCEDNREVLMGEACAVPTSQLIERLTLAVNAPLYKGGGVNLNALPGFFRTWARVAWGDLLAILPDEDTAELGEEAAASEEFCRLVREALLSLVVFGEDKGHGITSTQRRPLAHWCRMLASVGPWRDIRDLACWTKFLEAPEGGELVLQIALRHELFSQVGADRKIRQLKPNTFARRARKYGIGRSTRNDRPHGFSAIVLDTAFVAALVAGMPDDEEEPDTLANR